ncbi:MAG: AzlD domain-containing protein [Thiolinea sp.]
MLWIIFGMFAVTFGIRFVLYARAHKVTLPVWVEEALRFVPVAVLTALITPMILKPQGEWALDWHNPWLLGGLSAFAVGLWRQQPLLTIVVGVAVFFGARFLL